MLVLFLLNSFSVISQLHKTNFTASTMSPFADRGTITHLRGYCCRLAIHVNEISKYDIESFGLISLFIGSLLPFFTRTMTITYVLHIVPSKLRTEP